MLQGKTCIGPWKHSCFNYSSALSYGGNGSTIFVPPGQQLNTHEHVTLATANDLSENSNFCSSSRQLLGIGKVNSLNIFSILCLRNPEKVGSLQRGCPYLKTGVVSLNNINNQPTNPTKNPWEVGDLCLEQVLLLTFSTFYSSLIHPKHESNAFASSFHFYLFRNL